MKLAIDIWKRTFIALSRNRKLLAPFVVSAVFSFITLYILYLAPSRPVSIVLGPPIRAFFGERFLHYPNSIYLLPKLFYYAQIVVNSTIGLIMTGLAIGFVKDAYNKEDLKTSADLAVSFKRYFVLLGIWAVMFLSMFLISELIRKVFSYYGAGQLLTDSLVYIAGILAQVIFIYALPIAILEKKGLLGSLKQGLLFLKKFFFTTIVLIIVPAAVYLPLIVLSQYIPQLINKLWPEVVIIALVLGIIATFIIDIFFTCAPAFLLLQNKDEK